ncbi:putative alpha/beta hydrolase [Gregarina niphandrodes]|uniref:Alpha/beta hydrolase n=1 Tax=Gregarina niphandrodes TaxID=110365 RepID=A0A023BDD9_GRENI|nr:putative alpha/beta hydrolase [Gregarina niphandrodes]EZG88354.1 putative alpha/beta hydrolase [Gregarina niphandrodes]|eukprot:XP_011128581.1 putative alpha/beta hydrolase [Gregarina niphandrodes]
MSQGSPGKNHEQPVSITHTEDASSHQQGPDIFQEQGNPLEDHPSIKRKAKKKTCPYQVHSLFKGSLGITHYKLEGPEDGELVIGFHGLNGTRSTWQGAAKDLIAIGYQVLTYDLYGHGLSSCPPFDVFGGYTYTPQFFVDQLDELLVHLKLQDRSCSLIAFSLGALIACSFACKHMNLVLRLILVSPAGMLEHRPRSISAIMTCECLIPCSPCCVCRCCFNRKSFMDRCSSDDCASGAAQVMWDRIMWNLFDKRGTIPAFLGAVTRLPIWNGHDIYRKLGRTGIAILLLWGSTDTVVPVHIATTMLEELNNCHLIVFPGCTHLLLSERANECTALVATFLEFPKNAKLDDFHYLLPFTAEGEYRPPRSRCPPSMRQEVFFDLISYRPKRWFKVRSPKTNR